MRSLVARIVRRTIRAVTGANRSTFRRGLTIGRIGPIPIGLGQRLVGIEAPLDAGQLGGDRRRLAPARLGIGRGELALGMVDPGEDRLEAVIVPLRDRVELVIVAPRTLDGQAQECGAGRRDHVVEIVGALLEHPLDRLVADDVVRPADQEPGRRLGSASRRASAPASVSPASCSRTNRGNGVSRLKARMT